MAEVISGTPVTVEPPKKTPACLPEPLVKNVSLRKIRKEFGGDDGARTWMGHRHREATSGNCLSLRTRDPAIWQPEATAFSGMLAQC
jgi:hypothetical protein